MATDWLQGQVQRLLQEAAEALTAADWDTVKQRALSILALDPDNNDAKGLLDASDRAISASASDRPTAETAAKLVPQPSAEQPTSFADGRYVVQKFLGEGGKKKVYMAHDELLDRDVAFALIKTDGLDDISRTRINREAQAMGRLGSHPHIVTVFDLGEVDSSDKDPVSGAAIKQPFMVAELMGGGDVEGIVEDAPDHKLPLEQAIRIAVETCRGLDFAHSKGIVHRDLKPGNVWLTSDGVAKIGDFGLAVAIDRSRLTQAGMMVGTVSYMPPEQAMGGETTPKADLYSLGAMLYEMVTGRPPFLGDDSVAIIGQHINTPPVAPTWHRNDCPRPLEALILRLLSKDPNERPENARDVLTALESIDLSPTADSVSASTEGEANVLDSLAGGVFVGRQAEMGQLKAALEDALSGRGRMVTLVGEPGIGKTRTAQELATYAGLRGCQVLWGRCYEEQGVPPYWPWVQAMRSYVRDTDPDQLRSEMGSGAADIAEVVSDVRAKLPDLDAMPQLDSPEQARFRLFDSITAFLKTASQKKPIMLVLDDLHWSDKPSLMLLQFIAREFASSRLLLIGTYRDVELNRQHPLAETLGELTRERLFERVLLRGLSPQDVRRFIEVTSGIEPPSTLVNAVHTHTEGNPLFVTEVVRLLVQEGELTQEHVQDRDSWEIRVPEGVREVIGRRLNRLSERCNETLTVAAVVGREFTLQQLDKLIDDLNLEMVLDVLEEALTARLIEELPSAIGQYQFTHALMQETLINELSLTRRVRLHARIAETLESLYGDEAESHASELAHHYAQAEAVLGTDKLVKYSIAAGERAISSNAYEEALVHFQRAFTAKEGSSFADAGQAPWTGSGQVVDAETATILFGLGRAQVAIVGNTQAQEAIDTLRRAFDAYVDLGDRENAVAAATYPHGFLAWSSGTADMTARALGLVPPDSLEAGYIMYRHGAALSWENKDYEGAQENLDQAVEIARRQGDKILEVRSLVFIAQMRWVQGQLSEAVEKSLPLIELAQSLDELDPLVRARNICTQSLMCMGDGYEAKIHATAGLKAAECMHNSFWLARLLGLNAVLAILKGEWKVAHEFNARALAENPTGIFALANGVLLNLQLGNLEPCSEYIKQVLDEIRDARDGAGLERAYAAVTISLFARVTDTTELLDAAESAASQILSSPSIPNLYMNLVRSGLALIAIQRSDAESAKEQYSFLESWQGTQERAFIAYDRLLGLLAQTVGNLDVSTVHFEDALAFCRKAGYRPELAWSLCDYADMLLERKDEGDKEKAVAMLDESLAISTELGMRPLMERVLSRREILKA